MAENNGVKSGRIPFLDSVSNNCSFVLSMMH